jgi:hypothetical protein
MDEDLKRVAEAADRFVNGLDPRGGEVRVSVPALKLHFERTLSAAAERERELVEALRPFAVWAERMPDLVPEFPRDISKVVQIAIANGHLTGAHFRNAARVVQVKEAGK